MFSIPNGFTVIAQRSDGFVAVHKLTGKTILGETELDRFGNKYVKDVVEVERGNLFGAVNGTSRNGSTEKWRQLMANLMATLVQTESNRVQDAARAITAGR